MAKAPAHPQVRVDLGDRGYDIHIGPGTLGELPAIIKAAGGAAPARVALIWDCGLPEATASAVESKLRTASLDPLLIPLTPSESAKSIATLTGILTEMTRHRVERTDAVVALGGGIVGDLAGFAAAIYRRGIPVFQCPTTLLAMVDASVGGKTGVNLDPGDGNLKKNMVGAFHQPLAVIADISTLGSLPDRPFRAGLAECIKHGLISADFGDPGLLQWTLENLDHLLKRSSAALTQLVERNVRVKAAVVAGDEREELPAGGRSLLNLGHTFGHAIEPLPGLAPDGGFLQHGEAVGLGLIAAARCSQSAGLCDKTLADTIASAVNAAGLPTRVKGLPATPAVIALMGDDKKVQGGRLRLILPTAPGRSKVVADPPQSAVVAGVDSIRA